MLLLAAERRRSKSGSPQELAYGDGAAALLLGEGEPIARLVGHHGESVDFVDHFRGDGRDFDYGWEERWIRDEGYLKIVPPASPACWRRPAWRRRHHPLHHARAYAGSAKADGQDLRHRRRRGARRARRTLGDTGAAHALVMLVDALETAKEGDKIMVVAFGQGVDVLVFEVTAENAKLPKRRRLSGWLARRRGREELQKFLAFNEMLPIEKGMRAEFDKKTALSVLWRKRDMIYGLVGGKCKVCGTVQFPRSQVCVNPNCHAIDSQAYPFADRPRRT